jgi:hypothetical protein
MATEALRKKIGQTWNDDPNERRKNCKALSDLYEGAVRKYVEERIKREIKDANERWEMSRRILEIDMVKRIVDKLSRAYMNNPIRRLMDGTPKDQEAFDWYLKNINFDEIGQTIDKNYNNYKESLVQCYFHELTAKPKLKLLEPSTYIAVSSDPQDDTNATVFVIYFGKDDKKQDMLLCVSEGEVWIQNTKGEILKGQMDNIGNVDGLNMYGAMPYIYAKKTKTDVMPYPDESMISIATLIPMLCGDINYAIKYMSYAIIYGVNVKQELIKRGPNAFFNLLPFDETSPNKPEVGVLKPDIDIKEVFDGIMMQLQLWLNARGISASIMGYNSSGLSSGISKMIDEADVSGIIQQNQEIYRKMEKDIFNFIFHHGHDIWRNNNPAMPQYSFSPNCYVDVIFPQVEVIKTREDIIREVKEELGLRLISKKMAVKRLNPNMTDEELDEHMEEIKEDNTDNSEQPDMNETAEGEADNGG